MSQMMYVQITDMTAESSTGNQASVNIAQTIPYYTTETPPLFDPASQLALTVEFYFQYAVIAIGVFGAAVNALVLYALIANYAGEAKKRAINLLIINQNSLDLISCVLLIISYCIIALTLLVW